MQPRQRMSAFEWGLLLLLSALWGGSFFFSKVALAALPPLTIALARVGLAALVLWGLVLAARQPLPATARGWGRFLVMGALNNALPFSLIFWGQTQISSGLAAILNATTPLWTVLLAHGLTADEKLTAARLGGVLMGILGVGIIIGVGALGGPGLPLLAQLAVVGAALSYACAGIYGRRFRGEPPLVTAAGQVSASTLLLLPAALLIDRPWLREAPSLGVWGALLGLAVLSTALAYTIYFRLLASTGATNLLLVTLLIPVSALLLGGLFMGEPIVGRHLLGMAVIWLGLAALDGRLSAWISRRARAG